VLYKAELSEPSWSLLQDVVGDGTTMTVFDAMTSPARFYRVDLQATLFPWSRSAPLPFEVSPGLRR
jgi:hypothetical protein